MPLTSLHPAPLTERYLSLCDRYARFVTDAGKTVRRSAPESARALFESCGDTRQRALVTRLEVECAIFEETLAAGDRLTDSRKLLWRHFARSGLTPCTDLFDKIGDTDVVEVYGLDQIHLFQNLNFFDWIGFTLEQIYSEAWYQLTKRDAEVEKKLYETALRLVNGEVRGTIETGVPWHVIEEIGTETLFKTHIRIKYASPVYSAGQLACFVAVSECRHP